MPALHTVEVRWFPVTKPFPLSDYFDDSHEAAERTDWYAVPCAAGSGVKIREGRLETKLRSTAYGQFDFTDEITGNIEMWSKWAVELEPGDSPTEAILRSANWRSLTKLRSIRRFEICDDHVSETTDVAKSSCSFELTKLTIGGKTYWTTGFESVVLKNEPSQQSVHKLCSVVDFINQERALPAFSADASVGYPEWLDRTLAS